MDYNNNFDQNRLARWYNEYKKFKMSYSNNFNEDDMVSYESFRNLHRLYVFDISKQSEVINNGIANVRLEFNFNAPIPAVADAQVDLYCVSFYDRIWKLKSDGTKQYILK
jgi:predicted RNA-binding protein with PIN domain